MRRYLWGKSLHCKQILYVSYCYCPCCYFTMRERPLLDFSCRRHWSSMLVGGGVKNRFTSSTPLLKKT